MTCSQAGSRCPSTDSPHSWRESPLLRIYSLLTDAFGCRPPSQHSTTTQPLCSTCIPSESSRTVCATVLFPLCRQYSIPLFVRQASDLADKQQVIDAPGTRQHDLTVTPAATLSQSWYIPCCPRRAVCETSTHWNLDNTHHSYYHRLLQLRFVRLALLNAVLPTCRLWSTSGLPTSSTSSPHAIIQRRGVPR